MYNLLRSLQRSLILLFVPCGLNDFHPKILQSAYAAVFIVLIILAETLLISNLIMLATEVDVVKYTNRLLMLMAGILSFAIAVLYIRYPGKPPVTTFFVGLLVIVVATVCMVGNTRFLILSGTTNVENRPGFVIE